MSRKQISHVPKLDPHEQRALMYKLLGVAQRLLPDERVSNCSKYLIRGEQAVTVKRNPADKKTWFHGVQHCSSIWNCPVCANRVTGFRGRELTQALDNPAYDVVMFTYTLRHRREDTLSVLLDALKTAYKATKSGRFYQTLQADFGIAGSIRTIEVTWSPENGWHVHIHELMILTAEVMSRENPLFRLHMARLHTRLRKRWSHCLEKKGRDASWERGVHMNARRDVSKTYIAKLQLARELTRNVNKQARGHEGVTPFGMLDLIRQGEKGYSALFQEYAAEFKGTRQLYWSSGLKELLGLQDVQDHEITEEMVQETAGAEFEEIVSLFWDEWIVVVRADKRGELLKVASIGGQSAVRDFLDEIDIDVGLAIWARGTPVPE